jgi:ATP-dependent DNA helicase DinG
LIDDTISDLNGWGEVSKASLCLITNLNKIILEINKLIKYIQAKKYQNFKQELAGISKDIYKFVTTIQLLTSKENIESTFWLEEGYQGIKLIIQPWGIEYEEMNTTLQSNNSHNFIISSFADKKAMQSVENKLKIANQLDKIFIKKREDSFNLLKMILPADIPNPNSAEFGEIVSKIVLDISRKNNGGVVVSAPSRSIIENIYKNTSIGLKKEGIEVNAQGVSGSQSKVYQKYHSNQKSVLLANHQMLYKRDIPSDKIKCLIMVKLPFDIDYIPQKRSNPANFNDFKDKTLPKSVFKYLKIFQKLSKNRSEKGVFINLDNRVQTANYGDDFISSLPEISIDYIEVKNIAKEAKRWLR